MVPETQNYSEYLAHRASWSSIFGLACGFMFTAITFLVTQLPDTPDVGRQAALFFLSLVFYVFLSLIVFNSVEEIYHITEVPKLTTGLNIFNWLIYPAMFMWGISISVVFVFVDLPYLAIATGITWAAMFVALSVVLYKPFIQSRRSLSKE